MLPQALIDVLPAALETISEYAGVSRDLVDLYNRFRNPLDFVNRAVGLYGNSVRAVAGEAYRVARFFANQSTYLKYFDANEVIDPRLARSTNVPLGVWNPDQAFRYNIQFDVYIPQQNQFVRRNIYVYSKRPSTPESIILSAIEGLNKNLVKYRVQVDQFQPSADQVQNIQIISFERMRLGE